MASATDPGRTAAGDAVKANCEEAIALLEPAKDLPPDALLEKVDEAERAVVRARDGLIDRLRATPAGDGARRWRSALDLVNGALSLITGVEYSVQKIEREHLKEARKTLQMVNRGLGG